MLEKYIWNEVSHMGKKLIVILTIAALGIFTLAAVGCAAVTDQRAAVSGIVVADGLAQEGTQVKQGTTYSSA